MPAGSGGGRQGVRLLGTHDDESQHYGELAESATDAIRLLMRALTSVAHISGLTWGYLGN